MGTRGGAELCEKSGEITPSKRVFVIVLKHDNSVSPEQLRLLSKE